MKYPENYINSIICGDCLEVMKGIPDGAIDLIVTSPPYDNLREYGKTQWDFEGIASELFRIIKQGGVCVWVVNDQMTECSESLTSFKQALYFKEIGFNVHDTMIYSKRGTAFPNPKRYHQCFEYMFIFSKGQPITANLISDRKNSQSGNSHKGSWERQKDGDIKHRAKDEYFIGDVGLRWNIWEYNIGYNKSTKYIPAFEHPAMFPECLARDHIISWSNPKDIVLDPFSGSGTTAFSCKELGRQFIGIEINPIYVEISNKRLSQEYLFT